MSALGSSLNFLFQMVGGLYIMAVLIRFLLQLVKADFYNPLSQSIVKITGPLLNPLRKVIPGFKNIDMASLFLALGLQMLLIYVNFNAGAYRITGSFSASVPIAGLIIGSLVQLATDFLNIYMFSLIIIAVASWVAPQSYNPALMLLHQLTEPLTGRVRKVIPPLGGLDFSMMVILILILTLKNFLAALG